MSDILITRKHHLTARQAKQAAEQVATDLQNEFNLEYQWDQPSVLRFERSGLNGRLTLRKGEATIEVHLGFLFSAFRGSLEREIHRYFDERFV